MNITKNDIVEEIHHRNPSLTKRDARKIINDMVRYMRVNICRGNDVELRGFGALRRQEKKGCERRNPRTGERVLTKDSFKIKFVPAKDTKEMLRRNEA